MNELLNQSMNNNDVGMTKKKKLATMGDPFHVSNVIQPN